MTPTDPPPPAAGMKHAAAAAAAPRAVSASSAAVPCRIAIVGCGTVGDLHRERLSSEAGVEIVAICDPDADALARMAERLPRRPRLFRSEQDLLAAGVA